MLHNELILSDGWREQLDSHIVGCCGGYIVSEHLRVIDIRNGCLQITVSANSFACLPGCNVLRFVVEVEVKVRVRVSPVDRDLQYARSDHNGVDECGDLSGEARKWDRRGQAGIVTISLEIEREVGVISRLEHMD